METEIIKLISELSVATIFVLLYISERKRSQQLSDERVNDWRKWNETLLKSLEREMTGKG